MYKSLCIGVLLLAAFAFTSGHKAADASPTAPTALTSPAIVAKGALPNQTATITTTLYTPTQTGLYRLTVYATITKADPNSQSYWYYNLAWTDDGGSESEGSIVYQNVIAPRQFIYEGLFTQGGAIVPFQAKAGTPITHSMLQGGPPDNSAYSLYYTLERLE